MKCKVRLNMERIKLIKWMEQGQWKKMADSSFLGTCIMTYIMSANTNWNVSHKQQRFWTRCLWFPIIRECAEMEGTFRKRFAEGLLNRVFWVKTKTQVTQCAYSWSWINRLEWLPKLACKLRIGRQTAIALKKMAMQAPIKHYVLALLSHICDKYSVANQEIYEFCLQCLPKNHVNYIYAFLICILLRNELVATA